MSVMLEINSEKLDELLDSLVGRVMALRAKTVFGVPTGGTVVAALLARCADIEMVFDPAKASVIVDDLIDGGDTRLRWRRSFPDTPFEALLNKQTMPDKPWVVFPWDRTEEKSVQDIPTRLLQWIGEDPKREGLLETPRRFCEAWQYWMGGYKIDPSSLVKIFTESNRDTDQMVIVRRIHFTSHCEHHLAQFTGSVSVGYVPRKHVIGVSKIPRIVDVFARRLQLQERLASEVATTLFHSDLDPVGVAVVVRARHSCVDSRGVRAHGADMVSSKMMGCFYSSPAAREEFLLLEKGEQ